MQQGMLAAEKKCRLRCDQQSVAAEQLSPCGKLNFLTTGPSAFFDVVSILARFLHSVAAAMSRDGKTQEEKAGSC